MFGLISNQNIQSLFQKNSGVKAGFNLTVPAQDETGSRPIRDGPFHICKMLGGGGEGGVRQILGQFLQCHCGWEKSGAI